MLEQELKVALNAVRTAARLCRNVQRELLASHATTKDDKSPVTIADFGAQAVVNSILAEAFPDCLIMGEEDTAFLREPGGAPLLENVLLRAREVRPSFTQHSLLSAIDRGNHAGGVDGSFWVLDPVDGTKGFLRGEQYAVALALIRNGKVVLGVLGCPNFPADLDDAEAAVGRGCIVAAVRGAGARVYDLDGDRHQPALVSGAANPAIARFSESYEAGHTAQDQTAAIADELGITREPYRMDSQCKYAAVARGLAEIYLRLPVRKNYREKIWDHAAGAIVVEEAGGHVTDITGKPLDFSLGTTLAGNFGIIASNGRFHERVVNAVKKRFPAGS